MLKLKWYSSGVTINTLDVYVIQDGLLQVPIWAKKVYEITIFADLVVVHFYDILWKLVSKERIQTCIQSLGSTW